MFENRYKRNRIINDEQQAKLATKKVAVIGCGGLGGYVIEMLARLGIGELIVCDKDVFDETNLNRQLLATETNIGMKKAEATAKRVSEVNSEIKVTVICRELNQANAEALLKPYNPDLIIDAVDSPPAKVMLENICEELEVPLIHGAISGWFGQVATVMPGDKTLTKLYKDTSSNDDLGNPSFTPATIASIQVSEALKVLLGIREILQNQVMMVDLFSNELTIIKTK